MSWPTVFTSLLAGQDLTAEASGWAMDQIMGAEASPAQVAGFLVALRAKGETVEEMRGLADMMLAHASRIEVAGPSLDIVGTGGDRAHTVNISTMASIVAAGTGVRVVKHGNRAASSSSGSADVLEALGVNLRLSPDRVAAVALEAGITFCFAQTFHPSMRHAASARRDLGIGTAFNFLGPLTNPAQPTYAAVGVADPRMAPLIAGVFAGRGKDAVVFRGDDGLDELTISTTSSVWWVRSGQVQEHRLDPEQLGLTLQSAGDPARRRRGPQRRGGPGRPGRGDRTGPRRGGAERRDRAGPDRAGRGREHRGVHAPRCGRAWTGRSGRSTTGRPPRSSTGGSPRPPADGTPRAGSAVRPAESTRADAPALTR